MAAGKPHYRGQVSQTLKNLGKQKYMQGGVAGTAGDSLADSAEGAMYLLNRLPVPEGFLWLDHWMDKGLIRSGEPLGQARLWGANKWESNCVRTVIIHATMHTQGTIARPWRHDMRLGAASLGDGVVVARQGVAGEVVDTSRVLFQVADMSHMWLMLDVRLEEADKLILGQPVQFLPDGSRQKVGGKLTWISTTADQRTRTVKVRADLPNPTGRLRNETFGLGRIVLRAEPDAIVVPHEAVHWEGCCHVVFVRDKGFFDSDQSFKVFHVRTVRLGAKNEKFTEIIAGVLPGEVVATIGSDVLRAQLLKNSLGEGCCAE